MASELSIASLPQHRGRVRAQRIVLGWLLVGFAAYALLPWYFPQNLTLLKSLPGIFGGSDTASGLVQALSHGKPWLWVGLVGLVVALAAWRMPAGRAQGWALVAGSGFGLAGLLLCGFTIGARGWSFEVLNGVFGELASGQFGIGLGGVLALLALLMLLGAGIARLGYFRGDMFVAGAVVFCSALLLLFVALPVGKSLVGAFQAEDGSLSLAALADRLAHERVWGLGCLVGGVRCGVAWNTLFLALLTAAGTTLMGTLIALYAERGSKRLSKPLNVLAMLPIITPPFVVGLGLILLFGRAGLVNQFLEWAFGVPPTRWFYGLLGVWLAQMFAFTPIAFMIMRGVVQGISPSMEEAAQTLRASRIKTFTTVTLPLMKPGLANAFLVGFIESIADFGNPIIVGGQYAVLSTDIFFAIVGAQYDQGRAASLALILTGFALTVFFIQQRVLGKTNYTTVSGKGDAGMAMALPDRVRRLCLMVAGPWLLFTIVVYLFAFIGGFVQTWGRDYTPTLAHFRTAFDLQWGELGRVWAGTAWNSLFTTVKLAAIAAPICASIGLLISWLLARTQFVGQRVFEFSALLAFAIPGTVLGVSYILAFNVPPFELTGTGLIIVLCFVFRNLPVGVRAGTASFKQLDKSLDEASTMLRAGTATTLRRVVLPLLKPALVAALVYSFVRSMTTVSAVIFLVTAENELATTYIIGRVGNGDYGVALAYCTVLIVLMSAATALIQSLVGERKLGRRAHKDIEDPMASGIEFRNVTKRYGDAKSPLVVKGIDIVVPKGTLTTVLGPSGCGKTTLLRMIAGLDAPTSGQILIDGQDVTNLGPAERNVSMVFQSYALFPHMNVIENVGYGLSVLGVAKDEALRRARETMDNVGLSGYDQRLPSELSGGQQQRVAVARSLVLEPSVMLFDEPLSNLDARLRRSMREEIRALQQRLNLTVAYVTHDQAEALAVSDQIIVMDAGLIAQAGTPQQLYEHPNSEFVAGFMGEAMLFPGQALADGRVQLGPLSITPRRAMAAGPVKVAVRPEAWALLPAGAAVDTASGMLVATVSKCAYLGSVLEVTLATELGDIFVVSPEVERWWQPGDKATLRLLDHGISVVVA